MLLPLQILRNWINIFIFFLNKYLYLFFIINLFFCKHHISHNYVQRSCVRKALSNGYPMIHAYIGCDLLAMRRWRQGATMIATQGCIAMPLCIQCIKSRGDMRKRDCERERGGGRELRDPLHKYHPAHLLAVSVSLPGWGRAHWFIATA